jgi:uncharacterized membrane protein YhaH (DUF805 family)
MSDIRYKITFDGQLLPDVHRDDVLENLARLFKSDTQKIAQLFRGPVTLKRNLSETEADRYLAALRQAGAQARKEQDIASMLTLVDDEQVLDSKDTLPMTCPKCGHEQSKRDECEQCGVIVEKYIARQGEQTSAPSISIPPSLTTTSPYAPPQADLHGADEHQYSELKVFSLKGRIGRLRFLAWSLVASAAFLAAFFALLTTVSIVSLMVSHPSFLTGLGFSTLLGLTILFVNLSIGVQRLHDLGWSGWLWLLSLIPLVGGLLTLLLMILPGPREANRYGPPPPPNSMAVKLLAGVWLFIVIAMVLAAIVRPS